MKQNRKDAGIAIAGALLMGIAWWLLRRAPGMEQAFPVMRTLPFICLGVGAGLLGNGIAQLVQRWALQKDPELARQQEIEVGDERNIRLAEGAKARAFDLMVFVFGALMLIFALMQVDQAAILLLVGAYLLVQGYAVYCRIRLEKEM